MAKRKTKKKGGRTTARRVGAASINAENPLIKFGSIALGLVLANKVNEQIDKVTGDKIDSKIVAAGQGALGAALVFRKTKGRGMVPVVLKIAGGVLLGSGVKRAMSSFGIGGYQSIPAVNGYQSIPAVNGMLVPAETGLSGHVPNRVNIGAMMRRRA